jgi:hypothetical protein
MCLACLFYLLLFALFTFITPSGFSGCTGFPVPSGKMVHVFWGPAYGYLSLFALSVATRRYFNGVRKRQEFQ